MELKLVKIKGPSENIKGKELGGNNGEEAARWREG